MKRFSIFVFLVLFVALNFAMPNRRDSVESVVSSQPNSEKLKQLSKTDSLYIALGKAKEDSNKVNILNLLSWELTYSGNSNTAIELANQAISISERVKYKKGFLGAYNALANVYSHTGEHAEALKKYYLTLKISEELNYKPGIANAYNNIGSVYSNTNNYKEAILNFEAALSISKEIDYKKVTAIAYENIGIINQVNGNYEEALNNHLESLKIREQMRDKRAISWSYQNLAIDYASQKEYSTAYSFFLKALRLQEEVGDKFEICRIYANIGQLYLEQKNYKEALRYCEQGVIIANEIHFHEVVYQIENVISEIYEITGDANKALIHYKKYVVAKDSAQNLENEKRIVRAEMNYKFEKQREHEKMLLDKKEALIREELKYQRALSWSGIIGTLLISCLAIVLALSYRRKIRSNNLIALQKQEISRQKAGIEGQEEERRRISKELHDGLGGSLAGIKMNLENLTNVEKNNSKELQKIVTLVGEACKEVRDISHNLSPLSISDIPLSQVLQDLTGRFKVSGKIDIHLECFPEAEINKVNEEAKIEIYRITQECLNNIVKHANADKIHIGLLKEEGFLYLSIEDNGKGFDVQTTKKGLGLNNIKTRVDLLSGEMTIDSKIDRGTAINIKFKM